MADNSSTDGSVEFVAREYPWVRIVRSTRNLGFSAANNLAGKEAVGRFILLLNADTVLIDPLAPGIVPESGPKSQIANSLSLNVFRNSLAYAYTASAFRPNHD